MVNSCCVSSNKHQQTIIALHGPYDGHLELVFVLQNDPLNLQNKDRLQNTTAELDLPKLSWIKGTYETSLASPLKCLNSTKTVEQTVAVLC